MIQSFTPEQEASWLPLALACASPMDCAAVSTGQLEATLKRVSKQAVQYELQMRELEEKLALSLSNFRAIDGTLQDAFSRLRRASRQADRALVQQTPQIKESLQTSLEELEQLEETLPTVRTQVADIQSAYDSGRKKAQALVADLTWLNTGFFQRWRATIFSSSSPVSWRWKAALRLSLFVSLLFWGWLFWYLLKGTYRTYLHRLPWGELLRVP
ncbi:hypothetical protein K525DRAFT_199360 [Schizophyllum commune Loenen D]|nr:hypothetical protein K525DRAFT_199360 [Schizophyllum commune Loenen D]